MSFKLYIINGRKILTRVRSILTAKKQVKCPVVSTGRCFSLSFFFLLGKLGILSEAQTNMFGL